MSVVSDIARKNLKTMTPVEVNTLKSSTPSHPSMVFLGLNIIVSAGILVADNRLRFSN